MGKLPQGPNKAHLVQIYQMLVNSAAFFEDCEKNYGYWFKINVKTGVPVYITSDINAIKQIFATSSDTLDAGPAYNSVIASTVGHHSVFTLEGAAHLRQRKLLLPPFHKENIQLYVRLIQKISQDAIERWPKETHFTSFDEMQSITLDIMLTILFGTNSPARYLELRTLLNQLLNTGIIRVLINFQFYISELKYLIPVLIKKYYTILKKIDELIYKEIQEKKANHTHADYDVLSILIGARDEENQPMTDVEIRDELITLLIAGHDTSSTALSWAIYHVLSHPDIYEKIQTLLVNEPDYGFQHPYLEAIINETLRITPVVQNVARTTKKPFFINDFEFPEGALIVPSIYLVHHRADLWPNPNQFNPDRFLNQQITPYSFFPFGGGVRRCIGMQLAMLEMKILLFQIFKSTHLALKPGYKGKAARRGVISTPKGGVPIKVL